MASILRPGLLQGLSVVVAGGSALAQPLEALGASVSRVELDASSLEEPSLPSGLDVLVVDVSGAEGAQAALDSAWLVMRPAGAAAVPKIVLVAPADEAGRRGIENLARTTSIEWARFGVRVSAIDARSPDVTADLAGYLASPAGDYFSGAVL